MKRVALPWPTEARLYPARPTEEAEEKKKEDEVPGTWAGNAFCGRAGDDRRLRAPPDGDRTPATSRRGTALATGIKYYI